MLEVLDIRNNVKEKPEFRNLIHLTRRDQRLQP